VAEFFSAAGRAGANLIEISNITKTYHMGDVDVNVLRGVSFGVNDGEMLAIMGPSGSGKSTLMNTLGCLDKPTSGSYKLDGIETSALNDEQLADIRNKKIGFIFQTFNLLSRTPAIEQVELPLIYAGAKDRRKRALEALEAVGLKARAQHRPNELSGGQQQRVAIARALVNNPSIIMADEPTGNLDSKVGAEIMHILQTLNRERGVTVVMVTHDPNIANHCRRIIQVRDGVIEREEINNKPQVARAIDEVRTT
jgi:putative ABC transport system ATP-binding protein